MYLKPVQFGPVRLDWPLRYCVYHMYDGRKVTTYTTHQWYVVLEVCCVVYVGKPATRQNNGMSCWRYFVLVYVGKPPTRHTNGMSCWRYFVLVYVGKPPTRHTKGMSCWRYFVLVYVGKPPTRHTNGMSCWRYFVLVYVGKPPTRHTNGMSCWRYFVLCMSVNLQHDITMVCRVGGILCWRMSVNLQHDTPKWYVVWRMSVNLHLQPISWVFPFLMRGFSNVILSYYWSRAACSLIPSTMADEGKWSTGLLKISNRSIII